jgi:uncharacterized protein DUF6194
MTADEISAFVTAMPGAVAITANATTGAPVAAWGDTFFFHDPDADPDARRFPFATIVVKDYDGFDTASDLGRPGVFRVNIGVGRERFAEVIGHTPAEHAARQDDFDYAALDRVLPHPVYAPQGWVCVVSPGPASGAQVRALLTYAHARASQRRPG